MIVRTWHGYTTKHNADAYQQLLQTEILPKIKHQLKEQLLSTQVLRRSVNDEIEFFTLFYFQSLAAIKAFAGENYHQAHVPQAAQDLLIRFDPYTDHYELIR